MSKERVRRDFENMTCKEGGGKQNHNVSQEMAARYRRKKQLNVWWQQLMADTRKKAF